MSPAFFCLHSMSSMVVYKDYICPQNDNLRYLSQIMERIQYNILHTMNNKVHRNKEPGEYRVSPVDLETFLI